MSRFRPKYKLEQSNILTLPKMRRATRKRLNFDDVQDDRPPPRRPVINVKETTLSEREQKMVVEIVRLIPDANDKEEFMTDIKNGGIFSGGRNEVLSKWSELAPSQKTEEKAIEMMNVMLNVKRLWLLNLPDNILEAIIYRLSDMDFDDLYWSSVGVRNRLENIRGLLQQRNRRKRKLYALGLPSSIPATMEEASLAEAHAENQAYDEFLEIPMAVGDIVNLGNMHNFYVRTKDKCYYLVSYPYGNRPKTIFVSPPILDQVKSIHSVFIVTKKGGLYQNVDGAIKRIPLSAKTTIDRVYSIYSEQRTEEVSYFITTTGELWSFYGYETYNDLEEYVFRRQEKIDLPFKVEDVALAKKELVVQGSDGSLWRYELGVRPSELIVKGDSFNDPQNRLMPEDTVRSFLYADECIFIVDIFGNLHVTGGNVDRWFPLDYNSGMKDLYDRENQIYTIPLSYHWLKGADVRDIGNTRRGIDNITVKSMKTSLGLDITILFSNGTVMTGRKTMLFQDERFKQYPGELVMRPMPSFLHFIHDIGYNQNCLFVAASQTKEDFSIRECMVCGHDEDIQYRLPGFKDTHLCGEECFQDLMSETPSMLVGRRKRYSAAQNRKIKKVMKEYKQGRLRSGKGKNRRKVTSRKQAVAIALAEANSMR